QEPERASRRRPRRAAPHDGVADPGGLPRGEQRPARRPARETAGGGGPLTRGATEEEGTEALLALLEGPTAIAFVETEGDPVAVAKALADAAKDTKVLALRGGILSGQSLSGADVEELAKLPA